MAKPRRPTRAATDVRGTLGSLVRSTLAQAGVVREVLERGAREGRARLDEARRDRARDAALADLGQAVLELLEAGRHPELLEEPAVADAVAALEDAEAPPAPPPRRGRPAGERGERGERPAPRRAGAEDDGTVSSAGWRPPPARGGAVWRPPVEAAPAPAEERPRARPAPVRAGGISFAADDDDDLADYMHPDDVPPR
jgi:hypothetical protein